MNLQNIIDKIDYIEIKNAKNVEITGISHNSKTTQKGDIFVCLTGEHSDGHIYAQKAIENGAVALFCEKVLDINVPQIIVKSTRHQIADLANIFYNYPTKNINLMGVTGTNGKTTVTHLLQKIFEKNNEQCALIGTLGYKLASNDEYKDAKHTTPQAPELQATMNIIFENNIKNAVMEVSSHALEQNRVGGCEFNSAILTNLTQDHLDYHITMDNYFDAKAILFKNIKKDGFVVLNVDDKYFERFKNIVDKDVKLFTYGIKNNADFQAENIDFSAKGASFNCKTPVGEKTINLKMNGMFSVYNVLCALTSAFASNIDVDLAIKSLEDTKGVAGRFEAVSNAPLVIVDYAHTPDGLENVLKAAREIVPNDGRLICLFGCGGDRDATKRPKMGTIAEKIADKIVITSDNPRSEDPQQIITDILTGISSINGENIFVEPDRRKAIELIKSFAKSNDVIILAGKGHEDYQILKDKTIHFDDREEARKIFGAIHA